jgi:hypothetical protein
MTTEDALKQYNNLASRIFSKKNRKKNGMFKASTFVTAMKKIVAGSNDSYAGEELMLDTSAAMGMCKVSVNAHLAPTVLISFIFAALFVQWLVITCGTPVASAPTGHRKTRVQTVQSGRLRVRPLLHQCFSKVLKLVG